MVYDTRTEFLKLPLPHEKNDLREDLPRLIQQAKIIDTNAKEIDNKITSLGNKTVEQDNTLKSQASLISNLENNKATNEALAQTESNLSKSITSELNKERDERKNTLSNHDSDDAAHATMIKRIVMGDLSHCIGVALVEGGNGSGLWANCTIEGQLITPPKRYFDFHPIFSALDNTVICDGQLMQRHKKFYYKTITFESGPLKGKLARFICPEAMDGFEPYPSFFKNGQEIDEWFCGTFAAIDDGGTPKKLGSKSGRAPFVNVDFPTMQSYCRNRNTDGVDAFDMWDIFQVSELQYLFLIEYACPDSQGLIARGRVDTDAAANVDADDVARATWRGHVGLWGNVWQMVAGVEISTSGEVRLWKTDGTKEYVGTNFILPAYNTKWQYIKSFKTGKGAGYDFDALFIPDVQTDSLLEAVVPDGFWGRYGSVGNVLYLGGAWNGAAAAGLWCQTYYNAASTAGTYVGCRLAKK